MPTAAELRDLLEQYRPTTVLQLLQGEVPPALGLYKAEALMELDRYQEAYDCLDALIPLLDGEAWSQAECLWARVLLDLGHYDGGILSAQAAARSTADNAIRATALAWAAVGYGQKNCWNLADAHIRQAIELDPNSPHVLRAQARLRLIADQRLEARAVYDRMAKLDSAWARTYARWGLAYVAYLLGEFEQAAVLGEEALAASDEIITPIFTLVYVALAGEDLPALERLVAMLAARSPQAENLARLQEDLAQLKARQAGDERRRLAAFPSLVQRRNYCGPSTIELVLRYWQGGLDLTNDQIAQHVKFPHSGTPPYRMREFFHMIGFDTVRCTASAEQLKMLVDAGYPAIVEQEYSNSSHVAVVIGYDNAAGKIELQDPMTHAVTAMPVDQLNRLRRLYGDSAIVAFPNNQGHDKALARMGLFDDPVTVMVDQASLELDSNRPQAAADLMEKALKKQPTRLIAWMLRLVAVQELWKAALRTAPTQRQGLAAQLSKKQAADPQAARQQFYELLARARQHHPDAELIFQFDGSAALLENDIARALDAYQQASAADPDDARNFAALAECRFALREVDAALEAAYEAVRRRPDLAAGNLWAARCLAYLNRNNAEHYARIAVEQEPNWWLAHQALAEAYLQQENYAAAQRASDQALSLMPAQPDARLMRALTGLYEEDISDGVAELEDLLGKPETLTPITRFRAYRALCSVLFNAGLFDAAVAQINQLLSSFHDDPWGLEMLAITRSRAILQGEGPVSPASAAEIAALFERAVQANQGASWVIEEYLNNFWAVASPDAVLAVVERLKQAYPDNQAIYYLHGVMLARAERHAEAAQMMLAALAYPDAVTNQDGLLSAINIILGGLGLEAGDRAILAVALPEKGIPPAYLRRCLGLALANHPEEAADRARELLRESLQADPQDVVVMVHLGDVADDEQEKEALYRRAVMQAPHWDYARLSLVYFLLDTERENDALELTAGHEHDSLELLIAHGRCLLAVGHYEEAADVFAEVFTQRESLENWLCYFKWYAEKQSGRAEACLKTAQDGLACFGAENPRWYKYLSNAFCLLGRYEEALQALEEGAAHELPEDAVLEGRYEIAWAQNDYAAALPIVEQLAVHDSQPGTLNGWEQQRLRLLAELGRPDEARAFAESRQLDADGWGNAAWAILRADDKALTLEFAARALALDGENYAGLYTRAQALSDMNREAEAIEAYYRLRDIHPDEHNAYEKLAYRLAVRGELDEALALAERAVMLGSFCSFAWATRGMVHFLRGERAEALEDLETAWNQGDSDDRRQKNVEWWLLAEMHCDAPLATERKQQALSEANDIDRAAIAKMEALLRPAA
ncbi:MAG: C39 family peptidase [Chloroflexota bacterium]